jgi:hypothetical protein
MCQHRLHYLVLAFCDFDFGRLYPMNSSPYKFNRNIDMDWFDSIFLNEYSYLIKRKEG